MCPTCTLSKHPGVLHKLTIPRSLCRCDLSQCLVWLPCRQAKQQSPWVGSAPSGSSGSILSHPAFRHGFAERPPWFMTCQVAAGHAGQYRIAICLSRKTADSDRLAGHRSILLRASAIRSQGVAPGINMSTGAAEHGRAQQQKP